MNRKSHCKSQSYNKLIESIEAHTLKMEALAQEYFEANVEFINQLSSIDDGGELTRNGKLSLYDERFKGLLEGMENETKLLKREKINFQFRQDLMSAVDNAALS